MACSHRWESVCLTQCSFPKDALCVGKDLNGDAIYAGRTHHEGDVLPAKVIPAKKACYVSHGGKEHKKTECEVLVPTPCAKFTWQCACGGNVPPCAFDAGLKTKCCEKLYFGRVAHDCCITPGKIHPSQGVCYYPFNHEERKSVEYECLVLL